MAAHLPGAPSVRAYWDDLRSGTERVRPLTDEELEEAGVPAEERLRPGYVKAAAPLGGVFDFDPDFFGFSPKEAGIMDPQHRHFLMAAWEAMEDAGHVPSGFDGSIGIFAGCGTADYYRRNVLSNPGLVDDVGLFLLRHTGNDKDFLVTRASYLFDLQGPAVNVQTACSTSLVATHLAVQHLLSGECDMALAGGVTIEIPHKHGYQYVEGEILSPDGHCRAFDHRSAGTVFGSGAGVVVLRRLADAVEDGDHVYAVIRGTAVNNDGSRKVGYLAPSVDGQAECIAEAIAVADVEPTSIGYVECHGTGTPVGDPIEVAALTQAFNADGPTPDGFCGIGSVKTNIGHLDTAAGVASLIKATLAVQHGEIPPSLNYEAPNPILGIEATPFTVVDELRPWPADIDGPRRAGVNSLGVGGTNAFVVLEEAPERPTATPSERATVLTLAAKNRKALDGICDRLAAHLHEHPEVELADVAWTLNQGRHPFAERRVLAARDLEEAAKLLEERDNRRVFDHTAPAAERSIAFMFPGGGAQHPRMAADLYATEPTFARTLDEGFRILLDEHDVDLRQLLLDEVDDAAATLELPRFQIPAIFLVEIALARLLQEWGLEPTALVGHSMGENTAACIAGTMSFEDGLGLLALRGRLFERTDGGMAVAPVPPEELTDLLDELGLDLAVENAPDLSVVSGDRAALDVLRERLAATGVEVQPVKIDTAPHSRLLEPVLEEFRAHLRTMDLRAPKIPWVSNRTGTWITDEDATDPEYWVAHLRGKVRFSDCVATLAEDPNRILLEVGPGKTLSSLVRGHPAVRAPHEAIPTMRHPEEDVADDVALRAAMGRLWAAGLDVPVELLVETEGRQRLSLPTYAFQTQPFVIEPGAPATTARADAYIGRDQEDDWDWEVVWRSRDVEPAPAGHKTWMVVADRTGLGDDLALRLRRRGDDVVIVRPGDSYQVVSDQEYVIAPENGLGEYELLLQDVILAGHTPDRIVHLALIAEDDRDFRPGSSFFHRNQELGLHSLVLLAQAWGGTDLKRPLHISVATMGAHRVVDGDRAQWPEQATVLGPVQVIPRELPGVTVSAFDIDQGDLFPTGRLDRAMGAAVSAIRSVRANGLRADRTAADEQEAPRSRERVLEDMIFAEITAHPSGDIAAIRGDRRYVRDVRRTPPTSVEREPRIRPGGTVLITGGLGGIGLTIARALHESVGARIVLLTRGELPDRASWDERAKVGDGTGRRLAGLLDLEAQGVDVTVQHGDVTDADEMRMVVDEVRRTHGGIDAVVHAAGVIDDGPLIGKDLTDIDEVLGPKVYGTLVLEEVLADEELDLFVLFGSTSTITAPIGQVDYVAANSFLDALSGARHAHGETHYLTLGWGVWGDVGMAAEAVADDEPEPRPAAHILFDTVVTDRRGVTRLDARWPVATTWALDEHRTAADEALLPGAGYPELARAALAELGIDRPFELSDLLFLRPLAPTGDELDAQVVLTPVVDGYRFHVRQAVAPETTDAEGATRAASPGRVTTAEATIRLRELDRPPAVDVEAAAGPDPSARPTRTAQQDHLHFGPRWDVVTKVRQGDGVSVAHLHLADRFAGDLDDVGLHPALVDLGTGFAMDLVLGYTGATLWVPIRYDRIRAFGRLGADVVAVARIRPTDGSDDGVATFDVDLCDPDGTVVLEVRGFSIRRLDGPLEVAPAPMAGEIERDASTSSGHASPAELLLRHNVSQGIGADEGARAFGRVIRMRPVPVRYVTSMDLTALRDQAARVAADQLRGDAQGDVVFARPDIDVDYVEPRDEMESTLVSLWQELLGIRQVGVRDDFFELGGHSLIAVRLFARIRKLFSVDFPVSVLFDAPTIEAVAALIRDARPDDGTDDQDEEGGPIVVGTRPRYRHLVAMHPGEGGPGHPFFLVAGMFGNVMNLRHLAHRIGSDRPFFGVQAQGLYGGEEPHDDFVVMARAYLEEIRTVQPHGPYLLGGFSGGGITAVEMALQLRDAGEEVGAVVLLDTPTPFNPPLTVLDRAKIQRDNLSREGVSWVKQWAVNRVRWEQEKRRRRDGGTTETDSGTLHSTEIEQGFYRALERYEMRHYPGVLTLFRPKLDPLHVFGPDRQINIDRRFIFDDNGWGPWCERVDVTEVPGTHDSAVLEPHVRVLAGHLRETLDRADAPTATD
ncbi:MAG: SDR family NAD(P)-dependent oxidoreductase [Actinobacteria bacterium]|nr:SDR family NAD(P)-dependent oxidoreductase [Actinomycetota bacterium]